MSTPILLLVVAATAFIAFGLQVLSRQIQRNPVDGRRPDPLIDTARTTSVTLRPAELHRLVGMIGDARLSEASYRSDLQPLLDQLGSVEVPGAGRSLVERIGRGRSERLRRIDRAIAELEAHWGIEDHT